MTNLKENKTTNFFSLIEILVVIGIIGILTSILLPALQKAKVEALFTECKSNQKQIAIAAFSYSSDHDGNMIYGSWHTEPNRVHMGNDGVSWTDLLNSYAGGPLDTWDDMLGVLTKTNDPDGSKSVGIFGCPADQWGENRAGPRKSSYAANIMVLGKTYSAGGDGMTGTWNSSPVMIYRYEESRNNINSTNNEPGQLKEGKLKDTAGTFIISDHPSNHVNTAFQGTTHGRNHITAVYNINSGGSNVSIESQLRVQGYDDDLTSLREKTNTAALELHQFRFNYLFADGHVEGINPYDTIGTGDLKAPKGIWTANPDD
ncbi:MAG: DUF1559 domain-containing protein [Lentisphaeria bacterium]|nr:DUF1559 domain-containing protein [Lentisphaeria bacterium]